MASNLPNVPIRDFPHQAIILDTVVTEKSSNKSGHYLPKEPGSAFIKNTHSKEQLTEFDGNEFLGQKASRDDEWMVQYWGTVPRLQDLYNWEISYAEGSAAAPSFQRTYLVKRDEYVTPTMLTPFVGLYRVRVTAGGSGYNTNSKFAPTVTFTGGTGSGGTGVALVNNQGQITKITLKTQGNYTVAPTGVVITPAAGDGGSGATAVAIIQPQTSVLTKEVVTNNAPAPYDSLYVVVTRLYEQIPGPVKVVSSEIDTNSGMKVTKTRQKKLASEITEGVVRDNSNEFVTITTKEGIEDTDSTIAYEVVTTIYKGPHFDEDTALIESVTRPYPFPGYLISYGEYGGMTITAIDLFGPTVGIRSAETSNVKHRILTYFIISDTIPDIAYDQIIFGSAFINGQAYNRILFDDLTRGWPPYGAYAQPGTTPTFREYFGDPGAITSGDPPPDPFAPGTGPKWIGTEKKITVDVTHYLAPDFLWKIEIAKVVMQ